MKEKIVWLVLALFCCLITPAAFADESSDCDKWFSREFSEKQPGFWIGDKPYGERFVMHFKTACEDIADTVKTFNEFQESLSKTTEGAIKSISESEIGVWAAENIGSGPEKIGNWAGELGVGAAEGLNEMNKRRKEFPMLVQQSSGKLANTVTETTPSSQSGSNSTNNNNSNAAVGKGKNSAVRNYYKVKYKVKENYYNYKGKVKATWYRLVDGLNVKSKDLQKRIPPSF